MITKFSYFVNSDYNQTITISDYNQFLFKKIFEVDKKHIISSEKLRKSGNCIYDYAHSLFKEDF